MKILLFKTGAIGDVIMTTPLIRQLRKQFPKAIIDYCVGNSSKVVLKNNPYLSNVFSFDESLFRKKSFVKYLSLIRKIRSEHYDIVFVLDKHWVFNLSAKFFGIRERIGFDRLGKEGLFLTKKVYYGAIRHEIFYYLDLLATISKSDYNDWKTELFPTDEDFDFAKSFWRENSLNKEKVFLVAPGGGNKEDKYAYLRLLPVNKWKLELKRISGKIVFIGTKQDQKIIKLLKTKNSIDLSGKTTIHQLAAIAKLANGVYCNDSGAMHITATENKHINSYFIITHPLKKAPLYKTSKAIFLGEKYYKLLPEVMGNYKYYEKIMRFKND